MTSHQGLHVSKIELNTDLRYRAGLILGLETDQKIGKNDVEVWIGAPSLQFDTCALMRHEET